MLNMASNILLERATNTSNQQPLMIAANYGAFSKVLSATPYVSTVDIPFWRGHGMY